MSSSTRGARRSRAPRRGRVPDKKKFREPLRRQTLIWRQLVAGDKNPEAYLGDAQRANVRDRLRALVWQRYRRVVPILAAILTIAAIGLPPALAFYQDSIVPTGLTSLVVAAIGAFGITRASLIFTVRSRVQDWADLLWQRAVAQRSGPRDADGRAGLPPSGDPRVQPTRRCDGTRRPEKAADHRDVTGARAEPRRSSDAGWSGVL